MNVTYILELLGGIPKDDDKVRSRTESMSESNWKLIFELWFDQPRFLLIITGGLMITYKLHIKI